MPAWVVDASVAVKWFVSEENSHIAERLLDRSAALHAPTLLKIELANALAKNVSKHLIGEDQATIVLGGIGQTIETWHAMEDTLPQAFAWALAYQHPVYDFCYLALARTLGIQVVTADHAFLRKLQGGADAQHAISLTEVR